jgi:2-O-(6-phospho-alpha-D-mannosyl)-D-glycerate hydrolase
VTVHVVPHTHWDREWYHPAAVFGLRLVRLVDDLLDLLERRPDFRTFLLDGQAVVLDDYLAARPEQAGRIRRLFAEGRLEAGPWFVLADEFLVSAEALVRNLLEGSRTVGRLGGRVPRVGYSPDAFGHPAGLPTLLALFGIEVAVVWRGLGGAPGEEGDLYRWRGPDGAEVLLVHLSPPGYENGQSLPRERDALRERWARIRAQLEPRARSPHWLVLAGADHHAAQHDLPDIVADLGALDPALGFAMSGLEDYAGALRRWIAETRAAPPPVAGELRAGHAHAWVLQGTFGSRLYLKQANAACQRLLERYAEPLAALELARAGTRDGRRAELRAAWRTLLENHPHDSICGTSADAVHREMVTRFERGLQQGTEIASRALDGTVGHDAVAAREAGRRAWRPGLLVMNPSPLRRDAVLEADVALFRREVSVGQQRVPPARPVRPGPYTLLGPGGRPLRVQELDARDGHDLVESPLRYPLSAAVEWRRVVIDARDLPPLGVTAFALEPGPRRGPGPAPGAHDVTVEGTAMRNGRLAVRVDPEGALEVTHLASGAAFRGLGALWDNGDAGDSYTYSTPRPDRVVRTPDAVAVRVAHAGPLRGELEIRRRYRAVDLDTVTRVTLDAGADAVGIAVSGENRRPDHRLRVAFPLGERAAREVADGLFGPVERIPGPRPPSPAGVEQPAPTAPMQRYVTAAGSSRALTVYADGLPEYELQADGTVLVTLLRAFGQLSREDMPERPGHAGWPTPTPDAQCRGPFSARLAVRPHAPEELDRREGIERAAEAFHAPPLAAMRRALLEIPTPVAGPSLAGEGLVFSAMKPADEGPGIVLRCTNALARPVSGAWRVPWPVREAQLVRLDEAPLAPLDVGPGGEVRFAAAPRSVVTVRLR